MKILIADKLNQAGTDWLKSQEDVEIDVKPGLSEDELAGIIGEYDGVIVRSGATVRQKGLSNHGRLKAIARAGVGVDNVDIAMATAKGVVVMNTPDANTTSTAELTVALMVALARRIAPANASLRAGEWNRKAYQGTQLADKMLGVVGMGRIGRTVARTAWALNMRVLGFDPFLSRAPELYRGETVNMVKNLNELCGQVDFLTVHVPKTAETTGMIGAEQLALMKPGARVINAARGGIVDEHALLDALNEGKIAGAGLDVYTAEPPESDVHKALIEHPGVLAVPHLGASTAEAQELVARQAAEQLVAFLRSGEVKNAVNAPGFAEDLDPLVRAYGDLARRMAMLLDEIAPGAPEKVEIVYRGALTEMNRSPVTAQTLAGLLERHMDQPVNVINAPLIAEQRGVEVSEATVGKTGEFNHLIEVRTSSVDWSHEASGTLMSDKFPRIVSVNGFRMELKPEGHVLFIFNEDKPGVVGRLGTVLGESKVNIADMMISRKREPAKAMMGIGLDSEPPAEIVDRIRSLEFVNLARHICFPPLGE